MCIRDSCQSVLGIAREVAAVLNKPLKMPATDYTVSDYKDPRLSICLLYTSVYYGVPAENFFIVTWMPDAEAAEAKIAALREEGDCVSRTQPPTT